MADGNISQITLPNGSVYDIKDTTSGFITGMTILSYGSSTWQDFIDAYNANKVVYCRASSNSNPASGSQTRLAFMAYVNNATAPTEVEFQYYRSVSTHTASQQGDQVYIYKLNKTNGWSVTVREASVKVVAGTGLGGTYSKGTMTLTGPTKVSDLTNDSGFLTSYTETDPTVPSWAKADSKPTYTASEVGAMSTSHAANAITSTDISNWNAKVSDDKTWNGVTLNKTYVTSTAENIRIPYSSAVTSTSMNFINATYVPSNCQIARYNANGNLIAVTPSANDNSTKVATTAYVDAAIPTVPTNVSAFTNDSGYAVINNTTVTLTTAGWSNNSQSVTVTGVTTSNNVIVTAAAASESTYLNCGVKCSSQAANTLTFICTTTPTDAIDVNVIVLTGN